MMGMDASVVRPQRRKFSCCTQKFGLAFGPAAEESRHRSVLVHEASRRVWGLWLRRTDQGLAMAPLARVAFRQCKSVSASWLHLFEAQYPARLYPCLRFAVHLAVPNAKLGAEWFATPFS